MTVAANLPRVANPAVSSPLPQASSEGPVSPVVADLISESAGKAPPPPRPVTPDDYIRWGTEMLTVNDVPAARRFFGYAAIAGSERGAILLAQTYGPAAETAVALPKADQSRVDQFRVDRAGVDRINTEPAKADVKSQPDWMVLKASAPSAADHSEAATPYAPQSTKQRLAHRRWNGSSRQAQARPPWYSVLYSRLRTITRDGP